MSGITANPIVQCVALAFLVVGCVSAPRYQVEVGGDLVRATDPDVAADVAELLASGRAKLARRVPDLENTSVEVWVQDLARA